MSVAIRRNKMVSFRLSPEEYQSLQAACAEHRVRSISDLARMAMQRLVLRRNESDPLTDEIRDLRERVRMLASELDRLSKLVETLSRDAWVG